MDWPITIDVEEFETRTCKRCGRKLVLFHFDGKSGVCNTCRQQQKHESYLRHGAKNELNRKIKRLLDITGE